MPQATTPRRGRLRAYFYFLLTLALLLLSSPAGAQSGPGDSPPAPVEAVPVAQREVMTKVTLAGTAEAVRTMTLAAAVEGIAVLGSVEEGDRVAKGQLLLQLDPVKPRLRLAETRALQAQAEAELEQLERDLTRSQTLYKSKAAPLKNLEDARTAVKRQQAVVDRYREQARLQEADLNDTAIRAPRAGVVIARHKYRGEWVEKGGGVLTMAVLDPLKVVVPVPERYLPDLKVGQEVVLTADALPEGHFKGTIRAIIPKGDPLSRSFPVQIMVANPEGELRPGNLIRATLTVGRPHQALLVPKDAIIIGTDGYSLVLVIDGKAQIREVKMVAEHGDLVEVSGQLAAGQMVVTRGNERLRPGQEVAIADGAGQAAPSAAESAR